MEVLGCYFLHKITNGEHVLQVEIFVRKLNSIPAFTANLTVESFNKRTLSWTRANVLWCFPSNFFSLDTRPFHCTSSYAYGNTTQLGMTGLICATLGCLFAYLPCSFNADLCHSVRPALGHPLQSDSVATNHYLCGFCFRCVFYLDKIIFPDGYIVLDLLWPEYEKYKCSVDFVLVSLSQ